MANTMQFVQNGGRLIIYTSSGSSPLHSGLCASQTSYSASTSLSEGQCQESAESEKFVSQVSHTLSGTYNYLIVDTAKLMGLGDGVLYAVYLSGNGTTLFAGDVIITSVDDQQGARGTIETQSITLVNSGSPVTGFGV